MFYDKIYCISGKGTAWEIQEVRERNGVKDILCLGLYGDKVYYCPDLHVIFYRYDNNGDIHYGWDYAVMSSTDERWERIKKEPFWETHICRIDALTVEPLTEEEALAVL